MRGDWIEKGREEIKMSAARETHVSSFAALIWPEAVLRVERFLMVASPLAD